LNIFSNGQVTALEGLTSLTTVGILYISGNDSLDTVDIPSFTTVDDDLHIANNKALCQSDAEAFAASITVGGDVQVYDNGSARTDCE